MHVSHSGASAAPSAPAATASSFAFPGAGFGTVLFLGLTAGVQMSDRGLQSILLSAIKSSFAVSDATLGALQGMAGILVASALAVPLARLADKMSRKRILLALIAGWGLLTALGALAPSFPIFFIGRAASGVTEFAMIPIVYSMIPDLVAERWRVASNLIFAALMATGASAGFYFGGYLLDFATHAGPLFGDALEPWRRVLVLLSLSSIPLLILGLFTTDPPRGRHDDEVLARLSFWTFVRDRRRDILLFVGTAGGLAIAVQSLTPMIAMALERRFSGGLSDIGHALGLITLATSLGCLPIAGMLDRALQRRLGTGTRPCIMAAMALATIPFTLMLGLSADMDVAFALIATFLFLTCTANALIPTMLQDLAPASLRARIFATYSFLISAFCAVGPLIAGGLSDRLFKGDLLWAIAVASMPALLAAAICAAAAILLAPDAGRGAASGSGAA